jgi:hypothetical protein
MGRGRACPEAPHGPTQDSELGGVRKHRKLGLLKRPVTATESAILLTMVAGIGPALRRSGASRCSGAWVPNYV